VKHSSDLVSQLIRALSRLPGIGPKSAERIVFYLLRTDVHESRTLANLMLRLKENMRFCDICSNLSESEHCFICEDPSRDRSILCVVEEPKDVLSIEKTKEFKGLYHVLLGALSPLDGVGPKQLRIQDLLKRLSKSEIKEVILATNPNSEGEATSLYLAKKLADFPVKVTRLARGLSIGSSLEYADQATLARSFLGRTTLVEQKKEVPYV
jgi:recombination protein RecR